MRDGQSVAIPKGIDHYPFGISLVWSAYENDQAQDYDFHVFTVPKWVVAAHDGCGYDMSMRNASHSKVADKYVYINNNVIDGYARNKEAGTGTSGVKYDNAYWVLREVWGV